MKLIILSDKFYKEYGGYREILKKPSRPYLCLTVKIDGVTFAIPIRHHINHPFCFKTIGDCGLDYTKAVILKDSSFIASDEAWIDTTEWNIIKRNENTIFYGFKKYLNQYKRAKKHPDNPRSRYFVQYSTLQYFDEAIMN